MKFLIGLIFISQYIAVPLVNANTIDHMNEHHHEHLDHTNHHKGNSHAEHSPHDDHDHELIEEVSDLALLSKEINAADADLVIQANQSNVSEATQILLKRDYQFYYKLYSPPDPQRILPLLI